MRKDATEKIPIHQMWETSSFSLRMDASHCGIQVILFILFFLSISIFDYA